MFTLTPRRKQALLYVAAGYQLKEFARREKLAYETVRSHLRYARFVYQAPTSAAAVTRALHAGDITYEDIEALQPFKMKDYYE